MSLDWARLGWDVAQTLLLFGVGIHQWLISRDRVRREVLDAMKSDLAKRIDHVEGTLDVRQDTLSTRVTVIEQSIAGRPSGAECGARLAQIQRLEEHIKHLPTVQSVKDGDARAHARIDQLVESVSEIKGGIRRVEGLLDTIHEHLLRHDK